MPVDIRGVEPVGLTGFETDYSYQLSGGNGTKDRERATFYRASKLFLLDDAFGALGAQT